MSSEAAGTKTIVIGVVERSSESGANVKRDGKQVRCIHETK